MNDDIKTDLISEYLVHLCDTDMAIKNSIHFLSRAIRLEDEIGKDVSLKEMRSQMENMSENIRKMIIEMEFKR